MAKRKSVSVGVKFPVKKRKELDEYLTDIPHDRCREIALKSICTVKGTLNVAHFSQRLEALQDPNGEEPLVNVVTAMCSNFKSYYSIFLARKRYPQFQQAWFLHIGQYIDGLGTDKETRTRSGRKVKDVGKNCRVEAKECKYLFDCFIKSLSTQVALQDQRVLVASLAYAVYDQMNDEVVSFKREELDNAEKKEPSIKFEDEDRYLGSAVHSMIECKKETAH